MMRAALAGAVAGLVLAALPGIAQRANPSSEETKILALENAWNQAEEHKDVKAMDQLLDASLVYIDYDGTRMSKAQFIASISAPSLNSEQIVNQSQEAHVFGDSAIVTGVYVEKGKNKGKPYQRRGRFTDTWVYRDGRWACVSSQSTLIQPGR